MVRGPDLSDSQADSAGSIPVTRSNQKPHVKAVIAVAGLTIKIHLRLRVPTVCPMGCPKLVSSASMIWLMAAAMKRSRSAVRY